MKRRVQKSWRRSLAQAFFTELHLVLPKYSIHNVWQFVHPRPCFIVRVVISERGAPSEDMIPNSAIHSSTIMYDITVFDLPENCGHALVKYQFLGR